MEAGHADEVAADGADLLMRLSAIAAVAAFMLALAGCGSSKSSNSEPKTVSSDLIAAAAAKSMKPGSVEADFNVSSAGVKGSGSGVFDTGPDRSGQLSMKVNLRGVPVPIDSIIAGNVLYLRSQAFAQLGLSGDKQWVKLDLGRLASERGLDLSSLTNTSPTPESALSYLRGTSKVQEVGSEKVGGVDTTHYKAKADLERAAARSKGSERESLRRLIRTTDAKKIPIDVWIDGKGLIRRLQYAQPAGGGRNVRVTMNLHDYGRRVSIKPPPAESVADLEKALGQG
jgi:hypothetical protein